MYARSVINTKGSSRSSDAYSLTVGVGVKNPTHDIKLTDLNGIEAGLILSNRSGRQDPRGMSISSMPRTALQMSQGNGGYDDMLPPFVTEVQSTWIGGRAQDTFSNDRTRFADSYRLDTTKEFPICAPKVSAQIGISEGDVTFGGTPTYQIDVTSGAGMTTYTPSNTTTITGLTVRITCSLLIPNDWAKLCYSLVVSETTPTCADYVTASDFDSSVLIMNNIYYPGETINLYANTTVDAGKTVYIIMKAFSFTNLPNNWGSIKVFTAPVTDVNFYRTSSIYQWELVESNAFLDCTINTIINYDIKMFEYRRQLYAIKNDLNRAGASLYMNGWRGVADVNTSYSVLADATQTGIATWANDAAKGCIVLIINGTGVNQAQPWRYVSSSADGVLTLSTQWDIKPDTTTEYVVLNSDKWFVVSTTVGEVDYMAKAVTSVAAVKDYLVFAFGDADEMSYYRFGCVSGAASEKWAVDTANKADLLCPIVNEYGDLKLWRADCDDCWVDCADVPDWLTPWTSPPALLFDVNAHERADLLLQQQRAVVDWDTENAKGDKDTGYLTSLERTILDLDYQISSHAAEGEAVGTGPDLVDPEGVTYITTAASTAHKYLPTKIYCGNTNARITNIIGYGQPEIPYILKEDGFGSVYNNIYQQMPVGEMSSVRSEDNGKSAMQFGVYMYFNLAGGMLERYYDQRLDDIGPNRDEGLPINRQGEIRKIIPYPGRFYAAVDAGFSGYSSVLCNNMLGWHEIYRSNVMGARINDIYIQSIPGNQYVDRLWISEGMDLIALPIALAPLSQSQYPYFGYRDVESSGYIETSWIDFDLKDVEKYFHSVTVFSDYSGDVKTGNEYEINVWFRVDGDNEWSYAGRAKASEVVDGKRQVGVKEIELRYYSPIHQTPHNVSGKKIKFKISLTPMADEYETPRLKALLVNAVLRMPIKRSWNVTFMLEPMKDLQGRQLTDTPALLYNQLYTWANSKTHATPLLMRTNDAITDNKYVFIDPASITPFQAVAQMGDGSGNQEYRHIATMTIYEV